MAQLHKTGIVEITKDISWVWVANGSNKEIAIIGKFEKPEGGKVDIKIHITKVITPKDKEKNWILSGKLSETKLVTINYCEKDGQARYVLTDAPQPQKDAFPKNPFKGTIFDDIWPFK